MHHYNPKIHHRRNIRLQGYDYSQAGAYFITICIHNMKCMFGEIAVGAGFTPARNSEAISDDKIIVNNDGARVNHDGAHVNHDGAHVKNERAGVNPAPTIGDIIGAYKSLVSNDCLEQFKINHLNAGKEHHQIPMMGKLLQRNYWEHIIRNETSYKRIADYIINNPDNWKGDKFYNE
jgi:hypothetical protein